MAPTTNLLRNVIMQWQISVWIVIVFMLTGWVLNCIAFVAPNWNTIESIHWGLWLMCSGSSGCETISNDALTDIMQVGRAFLVVGFISYIGIIVLVVLYLFWKSDIRLLAAAAGSALVTLISLFLGAILWMSSVNTTLSWCYYLCYVSALLVAASGGIILHIRRQERLKNVELQIPI